MIVMGHKVDGLGLKVGLGPEKLLEDCWFFGNTKIMSSITLSQDHPSHQPPYQSIQKLSVNNSTRNGTSNEGAGRRRRRKSQETSSKNSVPATASVEDEDDDEDEEEMEFSMGKLIRQASLNNSHTFPPNKQGVMTASSGKKAEVDTPQQLMSQKSLSALQCKELDLVSNSSTNPAAELKREKVGERKLTRTQSWAPPVPVKWTTAKTKTSKEDIKTQIKFWARAVASNVNPE